MGDCACELQFSRCSGTADSDYGSVACNRAESKGCFLCCEVEEGKGRIKRLVHEAAGP